MGNQGILIRIPRKKKLPAINKGILETGFESRILEIASLGFSSD
jgi:hypothetical protein